MKRQVLYASMLKTNIFDPKNNLINIIVGLHLKVFYPFIAFRASGA